MRDVPLNLNVSYTERINTVLDAVYVGKADALPLHAKLLRILRRRKKKLILDENLGTNRRLPVAVIRWKAVVKKTIMDVSFNGDQP